MISLSSTTNRVFCITFFGIAQVSTVARIWIRYRKQRLWWDDGWAFLTMLLSILMDVLIFVQGLDPLVPISPHIQVVNYWLILISFTVAVWCARISLMFSIIRLIPSFFTLRRISEWAAVFFSLLCLGILAPKVYICASDRSWYHMPIPRCKVGLKNPNIAIGELITDVLADITLVVIPIRLLGHVNLTSDKRRMLFIIFGANLLTSAVSIIRVVFLMGPSFQYVISVILVEVEVGTALTVANLGVVMPFLYRLIGKRDGDIDSKPYTHYPSFQTNGDIRMRRVSDLIASGIRLTDTGRVSTSARVQEPELERKQLMALGSSFSSVSNTSPSDGTGCETPKTEDLQGNSM
ncbi:hypothetical protein BT96DRAFT_849516 [Gymnopus androsaceus JB14]|uniref:Rhodopsin domain-containing protein n=1 Tax=Gymnopus androsaceus JB14 TaxID=1447944 RepID=A0A6A4I8M8_9AGAR|nr:hypothetical protein BT96DRAFT_849516 [Gymnopus androsaceus JB14]